MKRSPLETLKGATALFAEDDPVAREEIGEILDHYFAKVYKAAGGEEALAVLEREPGVSVVIADILMAEMSGLELIRTLRQRGSTVCALVITGEKSEELLLEAVTLKLTGYLLKPLSLRVLKEGLEACGRELGAAGGGKEALVPINERVFFDPRNAVLLIDDDPCELTRLEYAFLSLALKHPNMLITREMLQEYVWEEEKMSDAALKNFLIRLRGKIGKETVETVKGFGVRMVIGR